MNIASVGSVALCILFAAACGDDSDSAGDGSPPPDRTPGIVPDRSAPPKTPGVAQDASTIPGPTTPLVDSGAKGDASSAAQPALDASSSGNDAATVGAPRTDAGVVSAPEASVLNDGAAAVVPDASAPQCLSAGTSCITGVCCAGTTCVSDAIAGITVCAAQCTSPTECMSGCCAAVTGSTMGACAPLSVCGAPPARTGCNLIAADGTFLGKASSNAFDAEGVCNEFSVYGSEFGTQSIFNEFGTYGSEFSTQSAYNQFTTTPPAIICDGGVIRGYVTKSIKANAIDPDALCSTLAANGL